MIKQLVYLGKKEEKKNRTIISREAQMKKVTLA